MNIKTETFIKDGDFINYIVKYEEKQKYIDTSITFEVYEIVSWDLDNKPYIDEAEIYAKCFVKWDGCSHIEWGDDGYIHMCGRVSYDNHIKVVNAIWEFAKSKITRFNNEVA
jgi:hypothetical protein